MRKFALLDSTVVRAFSKATAQAKGAANAMTTLAKSSTPELAGIMKNRGIVQKRLGQAKNIGTMAVNSPQYAGIDKGFITSEFDKTQKSVRSSATEGLFASVTRALGR
jgi:hypothetical protein